MNKDLGALGEGAPRHRQYWITNMETAIVAAHHVQRGSVVNGSMSDFMHHKQRDHHTRRSSGSVIYRRQRRRPRELEREQLTGGRRIQTSCHAIRHYIFEPVKHDRPLLTRNRVNESPKGVTHSLVCCCSAEPAEKKDKSIMSALGTPFSRASSRRCTCFLLTLYIIDG